MKSLASLSLWRIIILILPLVSLGQTFEYGWPDNYDKPPQCVDIPVDLRLCQGVGYHQMLLPNLLEHESMAEVKQQAGSWVPLLHKNCDPGTQLLLCSLFAPVCMERPIYPCRRLCENVRDGCSPIMAAFGFPWPHILTCDKFPQDDMCINTPNDTSTSEPNGHPPVCPPCDNEMKMDVILDHMCASEFGAASTKGEQRESDFLLPSEEENKSWFWLASDKTIKFHSVFEMGYCLRQTAKEDTLQAVKFCLSDKVNL